MLDNDLYARMNHYISSLVIGTFTKWLVQVYGMDEYKEFFSYRDSREGLKKVFGKDIAEMDQMFLDYTRRFDIDDKTQKGMEGAIRKVLVSGGVQ